MIAAPSPDPARALVPPVLVPPVPVPPVSEKTTTVVIGSGFSALAVAAELNRQGVEAIIVDGSCTLRQHSPLQPTTGGISLEALSERSEIVRLLEHYARRHELDIRPETKALDLTRAHPASNRQWRVQTAQGILKAHCVIFTRGALSQLRRVLQGVGVTTATDLRASMHALGIYLVGVGDLEVPTTHEILHQARRAGQSIASRMAAHELGSPQAMA